MNSSVLPIPEDEQKPPFPNPGKVFAGPIHKCLIYIFASCVLQWAYGLGANMVQSNITQLNGFFHATTIETTWLVGAYMAPNVSLAVFLIKIRNQFGLRVFAELSIICFLITCSLHLFVTNLQSALIVRFFAGMAAAPMSSLAFFYMIEAFAPAKKRTVGLSLNLMNIALAVPLSRLVSPSLIDHAGFHGLYALEMGLALIGFGCIFSLPLTPIKRAKVIEKLDFVSYGLIAIGLGINAAIMPVGKLYWWRDVQWMGWWLAFAVLCLVVASIIELNRKNPLIDLRWLFSREMLHIAVVLLMFRILLSEQATLASNFFNLFGLLNREMETMHFAVVAGTVLGGFTCALFFKPGREDLFHAIALILLAAGSFMDSHATNLTRPDQMLVSQGIIGIGYALFLPPSMSKGLATAIARGPQYILSFVAVFLFTQNTGGLMSSAFFGSMQIIFEKYHSNILTQQLVLTDPIVAADVKQLSAVYSHVLNDHTLLNSEGLAALAQKATLEANVLAYNDVFRLYSCIALIVLLMLLIRMGLRGYRNFRDRQTQISAQVA